MKISWIIQKLFESNRSQVETQIKKANNQEDANQLTSKIESNNQNLKEAAQKYLESDDSNSKKAIDEHIKPLIEKQITELNQTNITDPKSTVLAKMRLKCIIIY